MTSAFSGPHWYNWTSQVYEQLGESTLLEQYVVSFYWSMTTLTTTGYGDVVPITTSERILNIFILAGGATVFSYIVANISEIMSGSNHTEAYSAARITEIKEFLADARVSTQMFGEVVGHFKVRG